MTEHEYAMFFRAQWQMEITKVTEGWEANGFYIYPEESVRERRSLGRTIRTPVKEWVVYVTVTTPATHFEPEESDEMELTRFDNFGSALARILTLSYEEKVQNSLNDIEELALKVIN
jgi:hypothetical protein